MRIFKYELFTHCYIKYSQSTSVVLSLEWSPRMHTVVSRQHYGVGAKIGWLRTRMCTKGTTFTRGLLFQWAHTITIHLRKVWIYQRVIRSRQSKKDRQIQWPKEKSTTEHTNVLLHKYNIVFIRKEFLQRPEAVNQRRTDNTMCTLARHSSIINTHILCTDTICIFFNNVQDVYCIHLFIFKRIFFNLYWHIIFIIVLGVEPGWHTKGTTI